MQGGSRSNFWGELILQRRVQRRMSQRQLADAAAVNRSTLRRIEVGTARGDIDVIERLLLHLGYELEALQTEAAEERRKKAAALLADPEARSMAAMRWLADL